MSVCTEIENFQPQATRDGEVGIDLGIVRTVQLSDGTVYRLDVNEIKKLEDRIAVYQKLLERNKTSRQKLAKLGKAADFGKKVPSRKRRRLKEKIANLVPTHSQYPQGLHVQNCQSHSAEVWLGGN